MALKLEIVLEAVDRLSAPILRMQDRINAVSGATRRLSASLRTAFDIAGANRLASAVANVGAVAARTAGRLAMMGGGVGIAGAAGFNAAFIRPAADMERLSMTLETIMGSADRAREALAFVSNFAETTPFELGETSAAFVALRTNGIDPTQGALLAVGDAAAVFNTSLSESVTAFSAALRGEMDPLERFGIQARTVGENIQLDWEHQGRRFRAVVDKNNRAMIAQNVSLAWGMIAGGGMARLSRSWDGMLSNLRDRWSRFSLAVMNAGVFDWLKLRLDRLLASTGRMAEDGTMRTWAEATSSAFIRAFEGAERFLMGYDRIVDAGNQGGTERVPGLFERIDELGRRAGDAFAALQRVLRPIVGDFDALDAALVTLAAVSFAPLVTALTVLGTAILGTPAGLALAAITAIGVAGMAIKENWWGLGDWLGGQWAALARFADSSIRSMVDGPLNTFRAIAGDLERAWGGVGRFFEELFGGIERRALAVVGTVGKLLSLLPGGGESPTGPANDPAAQLRRRLNEGKRGEAEGFYGPPALTPERMNFMGGGRAGGGNTVNVGGQIRVTVDDQRVRVRAAGTNRNVPLDVDQGLLMTPA